MTTIANLPLFEAVPFLTPIFSLSWLGTIGAIFALTHVTAIGISLYLHRYSAHRALHLHPALCHFFRFWLWLTTGMETKAWTAIHRKHHARCETEEDPHSPQVLGLKKVLAEGSELYRNEAKNQETLARYGQGTPEDWLEKNVYEQHSGKGLLLMFLINFLLFGPIGITMWACQMVWSPVCAAGIINGIGHYFGYRNFECADASTNIVPWGFFIMGEELHNNHHTYATSAKFSVKSWEFDMGWLYIKLFSYLGLAQPKRLPPELHHNFNKKQVDVETVKALLRNRFEIMSTYSKQVIRPVFFEARAQLAQSKEKLSSAVYNALTREESTLSPRLKVLLDSTLKQQRLKKLCEVYQFQRKLEKIWSKTTATQKELVEALQDWCKQAEQTGIRSLQEFARSVKTFDNNEPRLLTH